MKNEEKLFFRLHLKLAAFLSLITICILVLFSGLYLMISEKTLYENHQLSLQHDLDTICAGLTQQSSVTINYLQSLEQNSNYYIFLWDRETPFYFNSLKHHAPLLSLAEQAYAYYQEALPFSSAGRSLVFSLSEDGQDYDILAARVLTGQPSAALSLDAVSQEKGLTLLLISPRTYFLEKLSRQRLSFLLLIALCSLLLLSFAYFFTGILLRPIRENQRRQLQFVSDASHELRTPLAVIRSCISIRPPSYEATIEQECIHMSRLIEDMLTLISLEKGTLPIQPVDLEPDTLLLNLYEQMLPLAAEKKQALRIKLPEDPLPMLFADPDKIRQLLSILIQNAFSYTPENGSVTLSADFVPSARERLSGFIRFQVSDTGVGIPDDQKKLIFERFYRTDASRSAKNHYGLGLCIAKEITEAHRGQITVTDAPGGGTVFSCLFPCRQKI